MKGIKEFKELAKLEGSYLNNKEKRGPKLGQNLGSIILA